MKKIWFVLFILLFNCCEDQISDSDLDLSDQTIPDSIIIKSNDFIISYVGEEFFNAYISFDSAYYYDAVSFYIENPNNCLPFLQHPHYLMVYNFIIPEKSYVDEIIEFVVDTTGMVVPDREPFGIPTCPNNSCMGQFPLIDEEEAIQIAHDAGLEDGIEEWKTSFTYSAGEIDDYIWSISNTLYMDDNTSSGRIVIINSHNGDVIDILNWVIMP